MTLRPGSRLVQQVLMSLPSSSGSNGPSSSQPPSQPTASSGVAKSRRNQKKRAKARFAAELALVYQETLTHRGCQPSVPLVEVHDHMMTLAAASVAQQQDDDKKDPDEFLAKVFSLPDNDSCAQTPSALPELMMQRL